MRFVSMLWLAILASSLGATTGQADDFPAESIEFFEKEIRPLLVSRCFECHGDGDKPEAGLRLNSRAAILHGGERGPAAVPGKMDSLLVEAIRYRSLEMPPDGKLPDAEIQKLARWVSMGLPWPASEKASAVTTSGDAKFQISDEQRSFWSFQPIVAHAPPSVRDSSWPLGDIDRFVLAGIESKDLSPSPPANKPALLRRVTYDLIGLPPTPEELRDFLKDESPNAFEKVIDRLLASRQYGERWGRHWLDVVRYADSAGDVADYPVPQAYRYRNYVIDAFNNDKPYDVFLREQIAGDILANDAPPDRYAELITATGYIAVTRRFGYDRYRDMHLTISDTLDTLGRSVLGLSIGCARCHDHKFDPISAADYYGLYGIFASTRYPFPGAEESQRPIDFVPLLPQTEIAPRLAAKEAELERLKSEIAKHKEQEAALQTQLAKLDIVAGDFESQTLDGSLAAPWTSAGVANVHADAQSPFTNAIPRGSRGVWFPNDAGNNGILQKITPLAAGAEAVRYLNIDFRNVDAAAGGAGKYRICLCHDGNWSAAIEVFVDNDSVFVRNGQDLEAIQNIKSSSWHNLQITFDMQAKRWSGALYGDGKTSTFKDKAFASDWDGVIDAILVDAHLPNQGARPAHDIDNFFVSEQPFAAAESKEPSLKRESTESRDAQTLKPQLAAIQQTLAKLRAQHETTNNQPVGDTAYAVVEGTPVNVKIHRRGDPTKLGEEVPRRFLEILGNAAVPTTEPGSGRRQLADWITSRENPLTARVMVNRIWQHHFGAGLVDTPSDFGFRGHKPTHPELLDYLAMVFMNGGWSIKKLHKRILLSRTYQMSSADRAQAQAVDPTNKLLWRMNRQRLDAECIRDGMLAASGTLDASAGGPHPFPPVQSWGFTVHNPFKAQYETNRRSVYLMTQRIQRHPFLALFDGPDPAVSTDQRTLTTTPSQALFMMNDPFVHEQSVAFANRLLAHSAKMPMQLELAYQLAYARGPTPEEATRASEFMEKYDSKLVMLKIPDAERPRQVWAAYLRLLLSSSEFMFVD